MAKVTMRYHREGSRSGRASLFDRNSQEQHTPGAMGSSGSVTMRGKCVPAPGTMVREAPPDRLELLTEYERVQLVACLGMLIFKSRLINPDLVELLSKLSGADTRIWVEAKGDDTNC